MNQGDMQAQIYSTASRKYQTFSTSGVTSAPSMYEFQSTSIYGEKNKSSFSTAPMQMANGSIKTIASSVTGGVLTNNNEGGYIPPETGNNQGAVIAGVPDLPLSDGWDVALLLSFLCLGYAVYLKRKTIKDKVNG